MRVEDGDRFGLIALTGLIAIGVAAVAVAKTAELIYKMVKEMFSPSDFALLEAEAASKYPKELIDRVKKFPEGYRMIKYLAKSGDEEKRLITSLKDRFDEDVFMGKPTWLQDEGKAFRSWSSARNARSAHFSTFVRNQIHGSLIKEVVFSKHLDGTLFYLECQTLSLRHIFYHARYNFERIVGYVEGRSLQFKKV